MTSSGLDAKYICIPHRETVATGYFWIINGTYLNDLQLSDVFQGMDNNTGIGTLVFRNVPIEYNNTRVQCLAITDSDNEMPSNNSTLIIPGIYMHSCSLLSRPLKIIGHH